MSALLSTTPVEINGRTYQIRPLAFADARQVYAKMQRLLALHGDEAVTESKCGLFLFAGLIGAINDDDLKFFIDKFGPTTVCALDAQRTLPLTTDEHRSNVFAGCFEECLAWLDACVDVNYAGVMAKLGAAKTALEAKVEAAKAKPKS
ncbi:MAG: hypothetical protein RLZZ450_83 [Pseudomonadota bacterium]|jgi:hypothetical protein